MGILVADRKFLGEIGVLDEGMKVYGGENVELGIRVSQPRRTPGAFKASRETPERIHLWKGEKHDKGKKALSFLGLDVRRQHRGRSLLQDRPHREGPQALHA